MKRLSVITALFALAACVAIAQPNTTTISQTVYDQFGQPFTGTLKVTLSQRGATQNNAPVLNRTNSWTITNGVFQKALTLVPNDTMTPANSYYVFTFSNGNTLNCIIPTSSSPIPYTPYCTQVQPASPLQSVLPPQLNVNGLANGSYCINVVNNVATGWVQCSGSGSISWSSLTSAQWNALTSAQWTALVN